MSEYVEGLDNGARQSNQSVAQARKMKCWGVCLLVSGLIFTISALVLPYTLDSFFTDKIRGDTGIESSNEDFWSKTVAGSGTQEILRYHYLYNVTNIDDVIYKNATPEYREVGPYTFQEVNSYTDIKYGQSLKDAQSGATWKAITATLNQNLVLHADNSTDKSLDTPMYFANQAGLSYWHSQTKLKPKWETYTQLIYSTVVRELGQTTLDLSIFQRMSAEVFTKQARINKKLLPENPVSSKVARQLFTDVYYGLGNQTNYVLWNVLHHTADPLERVAWKWELRTYFGLTYAQIAEIEQNWNLLYQESYDAIIATIPVKDQAYANVQGAAYWQWAEARLTTKSFNQASVVMHDPSVFAGYPEFSYFQTKYFEKKVSPQNKKGMLSEVDFSKQLFKDGYENLFSTGIGEVDGPPASSLLNLQTMKILCELGSKVPDILRDKTQVYGVTFQMPPEWRQLASRLMLPDQRYVYMIWLWMETLWSETLLTKPADSSQVDVLSQRGADSLRKTITTMKLEVPLLTLTEEFASQNADLSCDQIFSGTFNLTAEQTARLCTSSEYFTFSDRFNSSFAVVNVYLYGDTFNRQYYDDFARAVWPTEGGVVDANSFFDPSIPSVFNPDLPLYQPPKWFETDIDEERRDLSQVQRVAQISPRDAGLLTIAKLQKESSGAEAASKSLLQQPSTPLNVTTGEQKKEEVELPNPFDSITSMKLPPVESESTLGQGDVIPSLFPSFEPFERALVREFAEDIIDILNVNYPETEDPLNPASPTSLKPSKPKEDAKVSTTEEEPSVEVAKAEQKGLVEPKDTDFKQSLLTEQQSKPQETLTSTSETESLPETKPPSKTVLASPKADIQFKPSAQRTTIDPVTEKISLDEGAASSQSQKQPALESTKVEPVMSEPAVSKKEAIKSETSSPWGKLMDQEPEPLPTPVGLVPSVKPVAAPLPDRTELQVESKNVTLPEVVPMTGSSSPLPKTETPVAVQQLNTTSAATSPKKEEVAEVQEKLTGGDTSGSKPTSVKSPVKEEESVQSPRLPSSTTAPPKEDASIVATTKPVTEQIPAVQVEKVATVPSNSTSEEPPLAAKTSTPAVSSTQVAPSPWSKLAKEAESAGPKEKIQQITKPVALEPSMPTKTSIEVAKEDVMGEQTRLSSVSNSTLVDISEPIFAKPPQVGASPWSKLVDEKVQSPQIKKEMPQTAAEVELQKTDKGSVLVTPVVANITEALAALKVTITTPAPSPIKPTATNQTIAETLPASPWAKLANPKTPQKADSTLSQQPVRSSAPQNVTVGASSEKTYQIPEVDISQSRSPYQEGDANLTMFNLTNNQTQATPEVRPKVGQTATKLSSKLGQKTMSSNFTQLMYAPNSAFEQKMTALQKDLFANFTVANVICGSQLEDLDICSFSNLTYNQWLDGSLLRRGSFKGQKLDRGYVNKYPDYSHLKISPELDKYSLMAGKSVPSHAQVSLAYDSFREMAAYSPRVYQEALSSGKSSVNGLLDEYLKFVAINFGLDGGAFTKRTPRQMIEGYQDGLMSDLKTRSLYDGGDVRPDTFVQLGRQRSYPDGEKNQIALLTGEDFIEQTRRIAKWSNSTNIAMPVREYVTSMTNVTKMVSPFKTEVALDGTDGLQFPPSVTQDSTLSFYSSEWARNVYFDYVDQTDRFKDIKTLKFTVNGALWNAQDQFDTKVNGTINVTSVFGANAVVTRSRYYGLDPEAAAVDGLIPQILNTTGQPMETGCVDDDDTIIGVEARTGIPVIWKQRSFYNLVVDGDSELLASGQTEQQFVPLVTVKREFEWSQADVDSELSSLISSQRWKWALFGVLAILGLLMLAISTVLLCKVRKMSKQMVSQSGADSR